MLLKDLKSQLALPEQTVLKGEWQLDSDHNLRYRIANFRELGLSRKIVLKTEILDARKDRLVVSVEHKQSATQRVIKVYELSGRWSLNRYNRLRFSLKTEDGRRDLLKFNQAWDIGKDHQLVYRYRKRELVRGVKQDHLFRLKGVWKILSDQALLYQLEGQSSGGLKLRAELGPKVLRAKKDTLRYRIGIGFRKTERISRELALTGRWLFSKSLKLGFEHILRSGDFLKQEFDLRWILNKQDHIEFHLENLQNGKKPWVLRFERQLADKEAQFFVEYRDRDDQSLFIGYNGDF